MYQIYMHIFPKYLYANEYNNETIINVNKVQMFNIREFFIMSDEYIDLEWDNIFKKDIFPKIGQNQN